MLEGEQFEELVCLISALNRDALIRQFAQYPSSFPIDFTPEFLASMSTERLRHIFLAICVQTKRMPHIEADSPMQSVA